MVTSLQCGQLIHSAGSSGGNFKIIALHALVLYSNKGEILSGPQIQALVRHGREYIDKLVPYMQMTVPEEGYREPEALEMIFRFMERLRVSTSLGILNLRAFFADRLSVCLPCRMNLTSPI